MALTLCIDFDGVIHEYKSKWVDSATICDGPVVGAINWLKALVADKDMKPSIYSSRSKTPEGVKAMKVWLTQNGMTLDEIRGLEFPTQKPAAFLTIDDRAICFRGTFPSKQEITHFKAWNKR